MLLRCVGWRKRNRDDHILSYADALDKTASASIEAIVGKRGILFAGFVARMGEERVPQRVVFGEIVGGKDYSGGQEKDLINYLRICWFGMKYLGLRKAVQEAVICFRRV